LANYIVVCRSGVRALVSAPSAARARADWAAAVERGAAELGEVRRPERGEVRELARANGGEHDYR
jgi:hypothetical protein